MKNRISSSGSAFPSRFFWMSCAGRSMLSLPPFEQGDDVGEIVRPQAKAGAGRKRLPSLVRWQRTQILPFARENHPLGRLFALGQLFRADRKVVAIEANQTSILSQIGDDRLEIEPPIGNVEGYQPAVSKLVEVEAHRFSRQQVHGNRIGAESVQNQQTILPFGSFLVLQPRISQNHV